MKYRRIIAKLLVEVKRIECGAGGEEDRVVRSMQYGACVRHVNSASGSSPDSSDELTSVFWMFRYNKSLGRCSIFSGFYFMNLH